LKQEGEMASQAYDVVLAGGGVMGCATAYYLLRYDPSLHIAIIEQEPGYEHNSTVLSDGNTRIQFNIKENIQMSQYGLQVLETFADDMAVDGRRPVPAFRQQGNLFTCGVDSVTSMQDGLALQRSLGCQVEWLEPGAIASRFPLYDPNRLAGGVFGAQDGTMDPQAVLAGYRDKAVEMGAKFIEGRVDRILCQGERVAGVRLASGERLAAPYVANTAGAWAADLARTARIEIPVIPVRRQVFVFEAVEAPQETYPLTVFPSGLYLIQEHGPVFMAGKSMDDDPVGYDFTWSRQTFEERIWPELVEYVPAFDRLKLVRGWAGLYAVNTFDGNAILGEWPGLRGLLLANGFSGHGFQQCHAVGRYLAELVLERPLSLDLGVFSPLRILENRPVYEGQGRLV
jgi:glycine/D-amino acid oxidase-like deaminating enzyme